MSLHCYKLNPDGSRTFLGTAHDGDISKFLPTVPEFKPKKFDVSIAVLTHELALHARDRQGDPTYHDTCTKDLEDAIKLLVKGLS